MESLTIYRATGKTIGLVLLFKYDLKGDLREFKIEEGELTNEQMKWLYSERFPANEQLIKRWSTNDNYKKVFTVEKFNSDISFNAFWVLWNLKIKKELAEKAWNKLNESEKIKCFLVHKSYETYLQKTGIPKAHLVTWLNQKRYNDEY